MLFQDGQTVRYLSKATGLAEVLEQFTQPVVGFLAVWKGCERRKSRKKLVEQMKCFHDIGWPLVLWRCDKEVVRNR